MIATDPQLNELLSKIQPHERVAIDTEADSLHCYREKLCLLQLSTPNEEDFIVDPLADVDLAPLGQTLQEREIVLHGADYDLRLLRRAFGFTAKRIFDTVIAARLLGIREFSLAALLKRYFDVDLVKGSQKANWAQRPLPKRMVDYAMNDTRYLLRLADILREQLRLTNRFDWFAQSCARAIEQAAVDRERDADETWRIAGAGALAPREAAVLRELWRWRESEAQHVDRPPFHILQNDQLLRAAKTFADGHEPHIRHFSPRRRSTFEDAAKKGLNVPEADWPVMRRRSGKRPTAAMVRKAEELKRRRDGAADKLQIEPSIVAPRTTLEAIASDGEQAANMLVPWQRELLDV